MRMIVGCGASSTFVTVSCGSVTITVIDGTVVIEFSLDGSTIITTLDALDSVTLDDETTTVTNNGRPPISIVAGEILQLTTQVTLDIKPGEDPNAINLKKEKSITVAILGSADFDISQIDDSTLEFGPDGASPLAKKGVRFEDVNEDGFVDLFAKFKTRDAGLQAGDTEACIKGNLNDGTFIEGCDSVKIKK